jgi:hypothetical protein
MTRKNKIIFYGGISLLTISYIIYNRWSKSIFYDEILKRIGGNSINFNELKVWSSKFLISVQSQNKPYIELQQSVVKEKAEELNNAMSGAGTDEEKIVSVFNSLNSKIEVAQVNSFYNAKYKSVLKNELQSELNKRWLSKITQIISFKPDVIYI